jgi:hypothetical protein
MLAEAAVVHGLLVAGKAAPAEVALVAMMEICGLAQTAVQAAPVQVAVAVVHFTTAMHRLVAELPNQVALAVVAL